LKKHFQLYFNSLKSRIIVSAFFMVIVILPIIGLVIFSAFQKHISASVKNELVAYSYSILSVAEVEHSVLIMPEALAENQFNISQSGLYGLITSKGNIPRTLWRSPSLLALIIPHNLKSPLIGEGKFYSLLVDKSNHFVYSFSVSFNEGEKAEEMILHIIKHQADYQLLMNEFRQQLWLVFIILMVGLLFLQFIWLRWSLKPLVNLKKEITGIEQGKENILKEKYPQELQQVTEQMNSLLNTEKNQRQRYRNALSDLAHSLKTPLAILQGHITDKNTQQSQEQLDAMGMMIEHQLKRAQSAGESSWHLGVKIAPSVNKLISGLQKIHREKALSLLQSIDDNIIFKGDETDLLEILGNLLDNACKAANQCVEISVVNEWALLTIIIEDDGCGILPEKIDDILQRGVRADTYLQGHGIGLAIVRDLVESYQGELAIESSAKYGGAKFTLSFTQ
jgi:two-component system sensor histidine kinase PhoQ